MMSEQLPSEFALRCEQMPDGWWFVTCLAHPGLLLCHQDLSTILADAPKVLSLLLSLDKMLLPEPPQERSRQTGTINLIAFVLGGDQKLAEMVLDALAAAGYVCVPREPTQKMLDEAYWSAHGENAAGVWRDMIAASECAS